MQVVLKVILDSRISTLRSKMNDEIFFPNCQKVIVQTDLLLYNKGPRSYRFDETYSKILLRPQEPIMSKSSRKEGLSRFVERVMVEKNLSRSDVKLRSGGEITDSYVSAIVSGSSTNPSVDKLKALARGLRVSERKLVAIAFAYLEEPHTERAVDQSHNLLLLDIRKKSVISSDVAEIAQEVIRLTPSERAIVLRYVKKLSARRHPQRRRKLA